MLYPIRPPNQSAGVLGEDPGFTDPAESPIPVCGDGDLAAPEDHTELSEDGECVRIGKRATRAP